MVEMENINAFGISSFGVTTLNDITATKDIVCKVKTLLKIIAGNKRIIILNNIRYA